MDKVRHVFTLLGFIKAVFILMFYICFDNSQVASTETKFNGVTYMQGTATSRETKMTAVRHVKNTKNRTQHLQVA